MRWQGHLAEVRPCMGLAGPSGRSGLRVGTPPNGRSKALTGPWWPSPPGQDPARSGHCESPPSSPSQLVPTTHRFRGKPVEADAVPTVGMTRGINREAAAVALRAHALGLEPPWRTTSKSERGYARSPQLRPARHPTAGAIGNSRAGAGRMKRRPTGRASTGTSGDPGRGNPAGGYQAIRQPGGGAYPGGRGPVGRNRGVEKRRVPEPPPYGHCPVARSPSHR